LILDVYVQVNTSGEASKYRIQPDAVLPFIEALPRFPRLRPRGLMTLAVFSADMGKVRPCFRLLRRLRDEAARRNGALVELSMGMSGDFDAAIEEGADVVRVGQAIFGRRPTPDGHYWPSLSSS
jgi:PLP dependent protein